VQVFLLTEPGTEETHEINPGIGESPQAISGANKMLKENNQRKSYSTKANLLVAGLAIIVMAGTAKAQEQSALAPQTAITNAVPAGIFASGLSRYALSAGYMLPLEANGRRHGNDSPSTELPESVSPAQKKQAGSVEAPRPITLEQVRQQALRNATISPLARLGQLSLEAARQHVLGAQADYFPKISATAVNLHFDQFLGQILTLQRPLTGGVAEVGVPIAYQTQTLVAVTLVQPITPILQVRELVKIARADQKIAMAKAGVTVARSASAAQTEVTYFRLLIARRKLIAAQWKLRNAEARPLYASASIEKINMPAPQPESLEAKTALMTADTEVKELTAELNRVMGWAEDTELEPVTPDPLVENISFADVADVSPSANPEVVEAEQTAVKARAASTLSKLAYVPIVAATSGFVYQNFTPLVPNNIGYGGVMVSYNLFDFGKREAAVREASAQKEMAEMAVGLTKAKVTASLKTSYTELEHTRQLSQMAQNMASSVTRVMNVSATPENADMIAARANVEIEMIEAELAHRQAYARLKALMGSQR
jgi:outer membrane protein TolC